MIRATASKSSEHAKKYFTEGLHRADYFIQDQEMPGYIWGKLADRLGVTGPATKSVFFDLCDNINPTNGQRLTRHNKSNRIAGYDFTFSACKSVSIVNAMAKEGDERIRIAFEACVNETLKDLEADAMTRVRINKVYEDRATSELAIAGFTHLTARPSKDHVPDMQLHHHAFIFNCTHDRIENTIKAAKFRSIISNTPYYNSLFQKRFSDEIVKLGYEIRANGNSFEIAKVPKELIQLFSKRKNEIDAFAKKHGITNAKELDSLGAKTRAKKVKGLSMTELQTDWRRQIKEFDKDFDYSFGINPHKTKDRDDPSVEIIIDRTLSHCFERASVISEKTLLQHAFRFALGNQSVSIDDLSNALKKDKRIIRVSQNDQEMCTTLEVLGEERELINLARGRLGKVKPITLDLNFSTNDQQEKAINEVLSTTNAITIIKGSAGTGKTTLMKKAIEKIDEAGMRVTVVAPTASASRGVLRSEGYKAETVAKLIIDEDMQRGLRNGLLWVDEAGLLGNKDMLAILKLAISKNARIVLAGDTAQHSSISRGDSLRLLNTVAKIPTAEINVIRRQQSDRYKAAIEDLAKGDIASGFDKLDKMGSIRTIHADKPTEGIVNRYMEAIQDKRAVLVVCPTHQEGEFLTADIRARLKDQKKLSKKEIQHIRYVNRNLTIAEKADTKIYQKGDVVQFNLPVKGISRGSQWVVSEIHGKDIEIINKTGDIHKLPVNKPDRYDVFNSAIISLAKGDKVRVTRNSFEPQSKTTKKRYLLKNKKEHKPSEPLLPKRMDNGLSLEVASVSRGGIIILRNPISKSRYVIDKDFGHLAHEYCVTSHASQGKTTSEVLIYAPSTVFGATNARQLYVSASRGKHLVSVFTDDKEGLLQHAMHLGDRQSGLELVGIDQLEMDLVQEKYRHECCHDLENELDKGIQRSPT